MEENDANVTPADISKTQWRSAKDRVRFIYLLASVFWLLIWFLIYQHLDLSPYAWTVFYYGLFYFAFTIFIVNEAETIEKPDAELGKINTLEEYSKTIASLSLGVAIFVSIHRGTNAFDILKRLIILPIAGFVFIVLGPLSFFWTDDTSPEIYVIRHFKAVLYMIGVFLISAFMIEMIHKIYWVSQPLTIEEAAGIEYDVLGMFT